MNPVTQKQTTINKRYGNKQFLVGIFFKYLILCFFSACCECTHLVFLFSRTALHKAVGKGGILHNI